MKLFVAILILFSFILKGQQNLVPNWSFEQYATCPTNGYGEINKAVPWFQPNTNGGAGGSSDFFNICINPNIFYAAKQFPRTGNGYAGGCQFQDSTIGHMDIGREYLETSLLDSLKKNSSYCIRFFANRANGSTWAIKQIQAVLSNDSLLYNDFSYGFIPGQNPVMESSCIISDTVNWIPVQTVYKALGGEKFLTIGNFTQGSFVNYLDAGPAGSIGYYLFDDVSVYELPEVNAGKDTNICAWANTIIGPQTVRSDIKYSWSPSYGLSDTTIANPTASPMVTTTYILTVTDTNQWACYPQMYDTVVIAIGGCLGINNSGKVDSEVKVFPNPFSSSTTFSFQQKGNYELKVFDVAGKLNESVKFTGKQFIFQNEFLSKGIYFYEVKNETNLYAHGRLIVE